MARSAYAVSRMRNPGAAAAVRAVVLAVFLTLLGSALPGAAQSRTASNPVVVAGSEPASAQAHLEAAEPAVSPAAVRSQAEVTGERHAPPGTAPCPTPLAAPDLLQPMPPVATTECPPARAAFRHAGRAPPSPSGI
ncbi:hypothetical protein [Streptomyces griseorubiginosus]|uniref:hypothetical protein n=1 Tax=Streptomyces griseorubiginosus TaxID=67304 RepID=UPI000A9134AF|nr:hypothetical protein [Streptomyces griseorubiginosus]